MADETVRKLLIKLGISTSDWKTAVNDIKAQLNSVNEQAKKDAAQMKATQKEQLDLTKQQISEQQRLTAEARTLSAVDQAKAQWQKQQQEAIKTALQQRLLETAEAKKQAVIQQSAVKMAQEQLRLDQQRFKLFQQQQSMMQKQNKQQTSAGGGAGILGGLGGFISNISGGGLIGGVAAGVLEGGLLGEGALKLLDSAGEKIHSLGQALVDATGPAVQLREQFEKLTNRAGVSPDEYLNKLRVATRGLADDVSLYRIANNYMQQGLHVTNDQIVRLVAATVNLARAQGKEAPEAMAALERASKTGRAQVLAMVTGLTRQELQLRGVSTALDSTTRNTMQFNQVLAALEAREKAIGTPATTLPELLKQWLIVQKNLIDDTAVAITRTEGFQNTIQTLSGILIKIGPLLSRFVEFIGTQLGNAFEIVTPAIKLFISTLHLIQAEIGAWQKIIGVITGSSTQLNALEERTTPFRKFIMDISIGFLNLSQYANEAAIRMTAVGNIAEAVAKGKLSQAKQIFDDIDNKINQSRLIYGQNVAEAVRFGYNLGDDKKPKAGPQHDVDPNVQGEKQRQQLELQIAKETSDIKYQMTLERLKKQEDDVKAAYDEGLTSLQQEVNAERAIYAAEHKAKLQEIIEERDEKIKNIRQTAATAGTPADIVKKQIDVANLAAQQKTEAENTTYQQKGFQLDTKLRTDQETAYRSYTDELAKIAKEGVQDRLKTLESEFKQGLIGADDYISQRKAIIAEELTITQQGLAERLEAAKNDAQETAKIRIQGIEAVRTADNQLTELTLQQNDIRLQSIKTHYDQAKEFLQTSLATAKTGVPQEGQEEQITASLYQLAQSQLQSLTAQQHQLEDSGQKYGKDWINTTDQIAKAQEELVQMQQKLIELRDTAGPLASIFGSIGGLAGATHTRAGGIISGISENLQSSFEALSKFNIQNQSAAAGGQKGGLFGGLVSSVQNLFHPNQSGSLTNIQKTATEIFNQGLTTTAGTVHTVNSELEQLIANLKSWISVLTPKGKGEEAPPDNNFVLQNSENTPENPNLFDVTQIPAHAGGIDFVPQTGPALLHQGESVLTAEETRVAAGLGNLVNGFGSALNKLVSSISSAAQKIAEVPTKVASTISPLNFTPSSDDVKPLPVLGTTAGGQDQGEGSATPLSVPGSGLQQFNTQIKQASEDAVPSFGASLKNLATNIGGIIQGLQGVIKGLTSGKTGGEGALGGASSLGQFGSSVGALAGPLGSVLGGVSGAAVGGIVGGIFGSKEKQLQQDIHKVTTQLNSIISDLQAGTISLSQAIQDLRTERQQAIQLLSQDPKGGKGGGKGGKKGYTPSQAQAVIQQIDSQIQALVNQQTQTLQSLSTSLEQVSNPQQYQEYLQTLTQIIQQYQTFASAAQGNAQEMTAANQYLNDSLNQYVVTLSQNLNQAQQTAINDALTLINLEYQRQQLINQEASQQYDILTQGVLTRQRTTAMTKGQEIGQIQYQAQMQMEQINEEISLQQYKVQTETQIFNLATTRIGLENQLLDAQEEQANYQILQVQALASVVSSLTSGLSSGQLTSQLTQDLSSGALPTESGLLYTLLELLGLSSNVPTTATQGQYGTTNWLAGIPASDASAAQYVASLDPNFPNLILSDQFAAAAADAQQYATQGEIDGYDMNDFIAWLQQQGQGAASGGDVTGPVAVGENGPEILMPGVKGTVLSNPIVTALNAMTGGGQSSNLGGGTSGMEVQTHQTLYDLTQQRTSMEMTVITARQSQIQNEMTLLQTYQDTFNNIANGSSPTQGLEDMVQKVWENRGRYGGANFRRQNI